MSTSDVQPSDLCSAVQDALDQLHDLRRTVTHLRREYALLDPAELAVDTLGDPTTAADALAQTRAALIVLTRVLDDANCAFDTVLSPASRLLRPRASETTGPV